MYTNSAYPSTLAKKNSNSSLPPTIKWCSYSIIWIPDSNTRRTEQTQSHMAQCLDYIFIEQILKHNPYLRMVQLCKNSKIFPNTVLFPDVL